MEKINQTKVPNFFVVGVVKGGTTSLYHALSNHPEVYLSPIKEVNYFSRKDIRPELFTREYKHASALDFDRYAAQGMKEIIHIAHIEKWDQYTQLFKGVKNEKAIGEISNSYAICPSSAQEIFNAFPESKIIIMLRNPIERIWSQYIMNLREGKTLEKNFILEIEHDHAKTQKGWGVSHQYLELGLYYEQIKRFKDLFSDRFKILYFEDFKQNSSAVLKELYTFLEIDPSVELLEDKKHNESAVPRFEKLNYFLANTGILPFFKRFFGRDFRQKVKSIIYTQKAMPEMKEEEKEYLRTFYRADIEKLGTYLGKDLLKFWNF